MATKKCRAITQNLAFLPSCVWFQVAQSMNLLVDPKPDMAMQASALDQAFSHTLVNSQGCAGIFSLETLLGKA
jgi:hypothetical protein